MAAHIRPSSAWSMSDLSFRTIPTIPHIAWSGSIAASERSIKKSTIHETTQNVCSKLIDRIGRNSKKASNRELAARGSGDQLPTLPETSYYSRSSFDSASSLKPSKNHRLLSRFRSSACRSFRSSRFSFTSTNPTATNMK